MVSIAKMLLLIGVVFIIAGGILYFFGRLGFNFSRLPGNIRIEGGNTTCVFFLGASIFLSILLTLILNLISRFLNH